MARLSMCLRVSTFPVTIVKHLYHCPIHSSILYTAIGKTRMERHLWISVPTTSLLSQSGIGFLVGGEAAINQAGSNK